MMSGEWWQVGDEQQRAGDFALAASQMAMTTGWVALSSPLPAARSGRTKSLFLFANYELVFHGDFSPKHE